MKSKSKYQKANGKRSAPGLRNSEVAFLPNPTFAF